MSAALKLDCGCKRLGVKGCRDGRPLCRVRRQRVNKYTRCLCTAYHFPHRYGSGVCQQRPDHARRQFEAFTGLSWETGDTL